MKILPFSLLKAALLLCSLWCVPVVRAQSVSIALRGWEQTTSANKVVPPPKVLAFDKDTLIRQLAADEYVSGKLATNEFPRNAVLAYNGAFVVNSGTNTWDVSNILTLQTGSNIISWGRTMFDGTQMTTNKVRELVTLVYDSTAHGGTMKFSASGMGLLTQSVEYNTSYGPFPPPFPSWNASMSLTAALAGEGVNAEGNGMVVSGSLHIARSWYFTIEPTNGPPPRVPQSHPLPTSK